MARREYHEARRPRGWDALRGTRDNPPVPAWVSYDEKGQRYTHPAKTRRIAEAWKFYYKDFRPGTSQVRVTKRRPPKAKTKQRKYLDCSPPKTPGSPGRTCPPGREPSRRKKRAAAAPPRRGTPERVLSGKTRKNPHRTRPEFRPGARVEWRADDGSTYRGTVVSSDEAAQRWLRGKRRERGQETLRFILKPPPGRVPVEMDLAYGSPIWHVPSEELTGSRGNPAGKRRTTTIGQRHCILRVAEADTDSRDDAARVSRAFAICTSSKQKSARLKKAGKTSRQKSARAHRREPGAAAKERRYEELLTRARKSRRSRRNPGAQRGLPYPDHYFLANLFEADWGAAPQWTSSPFRAMERGWAPSYAELQQEFSRFTDTSPVGKSRAAMIRSLDARWRRGTIEVAGWNRGKGVIWLEKRQWQ